jgi:citrate lyase beta subunit
MSEWHDVALVVAGSLGPAAIAVVTIRADRRKDRVVWLRDESTRRHDTYAKFIAAAAAVVADWSDVVLMPPTTADEQRTYDARRDVHYDALNLLSATVRLTAVPAVSSAAEEVLELIRSAPPLASELAGVADRAESTARWRDFEARFAHARTAFVDAARSTDIKPPDDP